MLGSKTSSPVSSKIHIRIKIIFMTINRNHSNIFFNVTKYTKIMFMLLPSMLVKEVKKAAPVAFAILFRSAFLHRLTPIAPASTKYLRHKSSIPPEQRITLTPVARIFCKRSFVMSNSRARIASSFSGSETST